MFRKLKGILRKRKAIKLLQKYLIIKSMEKEGKN